MANRERGTEERKDGRLEIPSSVLQDIGPLGPLPKTVLDIGCKVPKLYSAIHRRYHVAMSSDRLIAKY